MKEYKAIYSVKHFLLLFESFARQLLLCEKPRKARLQAGKPVQRTGLSFAVRYKDMKKVISPIIMAITSAFWLVIANIIDNSAFSYPLAETSIKSACRQQNLETLTTQLLRDLPSYTNRASQRARRLQRNNDIYSYTLLAGRPEFQPLPLNSFENATNEQKNSAAKVKQVFFTTLERQYIDKKAVELQEFHWLLLTQNQNGWHFVTMFTQTGSAANKQPPTPPRNSSNGKVAQGVKTWLRDCQAGSVRGMFKQWQK